jgi:uncharacterized membrane protein
MSVPFLTFVADAAPFPRFSDESVANAYVATAAIMFAVTLGLAGVWLARRWVRNGREG